MEEWLVADQVAIHVRAITVELAGHLPHATTHHHTRLHITLRMIYSGFRV